MRANRRVSVKTVIEVVWQIKKSMSQIIDKLKADGKIRKQERLSVARHP